MSTFFLPRRAARFVSLIVAAASLAAPLAIHAAGDEPPLPNDREPFVGAPFFLLSDATFGSTEPAKVRLEINAPEQLAPAGGVDVVLYRIDQPLAFLQKQRNLHRIQVDARPAAAEGLANTLTHLWDSWVVKARLAWQKLFSGEARRAVTSQAPALKTPGALNRPSTFEEPPQFKPLAGLPVIERFRYPVHQAKAILPPKDLKLAGSSSEFIQPSAGNVYIPLGARKPGLYLVEAMAGQHRATTLLFVSDTLALTKVSGAQMLVWSTARADGQAVPAAKVVWTDGVGVLKTGTTDAQGLLRLERDAPEQTYVFGEDPTGGVFISENFYYDSEIYNAKVYATTDRPLYRPGDTVRLKITGREFKNARESVAIADGEVGLVVRDPAGQVVATQTLGFAAATAGADGRFILPDNAVAGGYELLFTLHGESYTAAFRVADYQKPHFDIQWQPDKADFATGEAVAGTVQLAYPDGKPVAGARLSLSARAQALAMVEGELDYSGAFALKLTQTELTTDNDGKARFTLPAATQPSRYVLTVLATDGAAYRVRSTRELLVERGSAAWLLSPERQFSRPGESLAFRWSPGRRAADTAPATPVRWEWVRLEDRQRADGELPSGSAAGGSVALSFAQPGSYTVTLRDAQRRIVAASSHFVTGEGLKAPAGSIAIVFDRARYAPGDLAEALITFPEPVAQALVTLERERVDAAALITRGGEGFSTERLGPTQWKVKLRVTEAMSPNVTLSAAYAARGDMVFHNQGLVVAQPRIALEFKPGKAVYAPGEIATVELRTTVAGQPVPADVAVGVVDEMIYVLQPEIAPAIDDFFYHPRRNNVRTSVSLSFIGYDLATRKLGTLPDRSGQPQRAVKVLERPRRDNVDTAAWEPRLRTDAAGVARFSFKVPDSLTRWRMTGRAIDARGLVGQQTAWVRSDKPFYAKWTSPDWQRVGDRVQASVALFNQGREPQPVEWAATGAGVSQQGQLTLQPGANFISVPIDATQPGAAANGSAGAAPAASANASSASSAQVLTFTLRQGGRVVDTLATPLRRLPVGWPQSRELVLDLAGGPATLTLPADARNVRVTLAADAAAGAFSRWIDELVDYPFGCVEQTASRMLPLSIALQSLSAAQQPLAPMLTQRLSTARLSLAQMAGPQARFGWWGRGMAADPFLTAYAYYADWRATQALRAPLPAEHWQRLLDVYATEGVRLPPMQRALVLHWMQEMGLPVGSMVDALVEELAGTGGAGVAASSAAAAASGAGASSGATAGAAGAAIGGSGPRPGASVVLVGEPIGERDIALVLAVHTAGARASAAARAEADGAAARLAASPSPLVQSLLLMARRGTPQQAAALLAQVRGEQPTFDRAQSLSWLYKTMGAAPELRSRAGELAAPWVAATGSVGQPQWQLPPGARPPASIAPTGGAKVAFVAFDSNEAGQATPLPVRIERRLYRVVTQAKPTPPAGAASASAAVVLPGDGRLTVKLEAVAPGSALDTNTLYLDELSLRSERPMRWALLDVALPPGAAVEASTWGLDLQGAAGGSGQGGQGGQGGQASNTTPLERAVHQPTAQGYAVPVEQLAANQPVAFRHLLRFSQRGRYQLPPARLYRMYEPEAKAVEAGSGWASVEVR